MLRIADLKLPLGHAPDALVPAIVARLGIMPAELIEWHLARRATAARKKSAILLVYSVDVVLARTSGRRRTPTIAQSRPRPPARPARWWWARARAGCSPR